MSKKVIENQVKICDYLCIKKCVFQSRVLRKGEIYTFSETIKVPPHLDYIGEHKEHIVPAKEIRILKAEIRKLKKNIEILIRTKNKKE